MTGGSRYVPGQSNPVPNPVSSSSDPFTGSGRYVPGQPNAPSTTVPSAGDPFTGSGRYIAGTDPAATATNSSSYFPVQDFLRFDQANIEAITSINLKKKTNDKYFNSKVTKKSLVVLRKNLQKTRQDI